MKVLGIETSCDETAAAIYDSKLGLLSHELYTQADMHKEYGGVVPELASRDHIRKILPVCQGALSKANCELKDLTGIAYTKGPGLIGALMVGATFARTLGYALDIPTIGIHHLEAHILAPLLEEPAPSFPFLALLVSGGHSQIIEVSDIGKYKILGESIDDAAGEAFDKTAKLLGLPYPGGAHLAKLAEQGNPKRFHFPRPMIDRPGLDLSFSGLKTHVLQVAKSHELDDQTKADIAYAFQEAVVDTLFIKIKRAIEQTNLSRLVIAGGVGANLALRRKLTHYIHEIKGEIFFPRLEFCTDNAAMVALTGWHRLQRGEKDSLAIDVVARWDLEDLR